MSIMPFTLRRATVADVDEVAAVFSASFRVPTFLPMLHTIAEERSFEARGFRAIRFTDGAANEEKTPDIRYRWQRVVAG